MYSSQQGGCFLGKADNMVKPLDICAIPAQMIEVVWSQVEPLLFRVVDRNPDDICPHVTKQKLLAGDTLLISISDGAEIVAINILEVQELDTGLRVLYIPITAGTRMREWLEPFLAVAKRIAKDYKCVELRGMSVRKGWLNTLGKHGWESAYETIKCKVGE